MLHRSPREIGRRDTSLWTLEMAAEVSFEEGLTERRVSGETIRATLARLLGVRWQRAKRCGSPLPIPCTKEKRRRGRLMEVAEADPRWAIGFEEECWWSRLALSTLSSSGPRAREALCASSTLSHQRRPRSEGHLLLRALPAGVRSKVVEVRGRSARRWRNDPIPFVVLPEARSAR
jgi:hypothetical protein